MIDTIHFSEDSSSSSRTIFIPQLVISRRYIGARALLWMEHAFLTLKHLAYAQEIDIFYTQLGSAMEARVQHALRIIAASD